MAEEELSSSLEFTPTWVVAGVCFVIVLLSLFAERGLHKLGKYLLHEKQDALYEALQKLKEELMLLGFISLLLTVTQRSISRICIPAHVATHMLPCKRETAEHKTPAHYFLNHSTNNGRRLLSSETTSDHCQLKGKVPLLSLEGLHHLHIFIFVLAVVHVIFCVSTMVLGGARVRQWKRWEESIQKDRRSGKSTAQVGHHHRAFLKERADGYWRRAAIISWMIAFFKQFYGSITKSDYIALRQGFIKEHCPGNPDFDFHKYMMRTLEVDFRKIVGISWYLWLFVVLFLLLNVDGWNTYFWLAFLPLILLLLVGAKLEHIISRLAQDVEQTGVRANEGATRVRPSDEHFWFKKPRIVLNLIHFILFQNSFEIAFFFWIWSTYGIHSCIMEKLGYIIARLIMGVIVQVLCSYSTLPLYVIVTQMGSKFKEGMFDEKIHGAIDIWAEGAMSKSDDSKRSSSHSMHKMINNEASTTVDVAEQEMVVMERTINVLPCQVQPPASSS
uniref:MLO-like protein n=1 Tax=Rosa longicuspis var. longicuspis TaxID=2218487 RepID=A0A3S7L8D3_9ROSA|nr:MLO protein 4 [Rosa longicuspis var. longicuspis]